MFDYSSLSIQTITQSNQEFPNCPTKFTWATRHIPSAENDDKERNRGLLVSVVQLNLGEWIYSIKKLARLPFNVKLTTIYPLT